MPPGTLITKLSYDASENIEYIGSAAPDSAEDDTLWKIIRLTYDASDNITGTLYAEGTDSFDKKWSLRASYTYS